MIKINDNEVTIEVLNRYKPMWKYFKETSERLDIDPNVILVECIRKWDEVCTKHINTVSRKSARDSIDQLRGDRVEFECEDLLCELNEM